MDKERVELYFDRIGLETPDVIVPDGELLRKLTYHNIISIPYENTQFLTGKFVPCEDTDALFQRIVVEKKGGICHDISTLFGWFLTEIGYTVVPVGAVSFFEKIKSHIHKTMVVTDCGGNEWLTEVAHSLFSNNKFPIRFIPGQEHVYDGDVFRLEEREGKMCLIGPTVESSYSLEYWNIQPELGTRLKKFTVEGNDPAGPVIRGFAIGTPDGRRTLLGNTYRECFGDRLYTYECTPDTLPWAYAQFGISYRE